MSAISTPGGGGTTAQTKPTSGKQKFQKLDINSLYCANRNENSEPSLVKSQLSRKHGMQSLGKVPSARRPPANLPSLKTETGQDSNANSTSATTATVSTPPTCTAQTITSTTSVAAGTAPGGWVSLPPPSSSHFRTEFPSLEAASQPSHRSAEHSGVQTQLRPQTEGSWTSGGATAGRAASPAGAPASTPAAQQTPAFRAILPSFLMKGSSAGNIGLGTLNTGREQTSGARAPAAGRERARHAPPAGPPAPAPAAPRALEVLTARPILRDEQISSLDDISRDAGWAQHDDIDYDQKLDFSDGESTPSNKSNKNNRGSIDNERDSKIREPGDEDQIWAERRQKQIDEVALVAARGRQRKEEEQRRQNRDSVGPSQKDSRERLDERRDRNENKEREDSKENDKVEIRDRQDIREKDRMDSRNDNRDRDAREKERDNRVDQRDRFDNRDRDRDARERDRDSRERDRDNRDRRNERDRQSEDKDRMDIRDNRDRENRDRMDNRFDRDRDRGRDERERADRDRDRDFRERDYGRDRGQGQGFSKMFQENIPPRFLKQQQSRGGEERVEKGWGGGYGKQAPRRQEASYTAPRHAPHNGRRSFNRDSDREDDFRREKDASGAWRTEMQDFDRSARDMNIKDSYKDYEYKDRKEAERKPEVEQSNRTSAADKLTEVFERKSIGLIEPFAQKESVPPPVIERKTTPPSNISQRESVEKDLSKTSWAEVAQDEQNSHATSKPPETILPVKEDLKPKEIHQTEVEEPKPQVTPITPVQIVHPTFQSNSAANIPQINKFQNAAVHPITQPPSYVNVQSHPPPIHSSDGHNIQKTPLPAKPIQIESHPIIAQQPQKIVPSEQLTQANVKPILSTQKSERDFSESESVVSKSSTDASVLTSGKMTDSQLSVATTESKIEEKRNDQFKGINKEPVERKSSGSGSEKKGRGYGGGGGGGGGGGYVYSRGWGGRRPRRSSRSKGRASESDGSTDGPHAERRERRRAPRSPRGHKKPDRSEDNRAPPLDQNLPAPDGLENREPFAPRGQPSRRGRGGFQGASRPPAPAKRVTGYGPPNTKSPFSQANRAVKDTDEIKDVVHDDKGKVNKNRAGPSMGRGRDRRPKGAGGPQSGEDENWETTSEHSEGGSGVTRRRSVGGRQGQGTKTHSGRNPGGRQNMGRGGQNKRDFSENKTSEITEAMIDLKVTPKKDEEVMDDGFQEVRNKKTAKDARGSSKEDTSKSRSHSNHGRNGSSSRNPNEKNNGRGSAAVPGKSGPQYDRPRQANLAPRFVKQRQKQQLGLVSSFGPDTGAAPPPPPVNAWDKPIAQTLRGNIEDPPDPPELKPVAPAQRPTPPESAAESKTPPNTLTTDKTGVLDGTTPPVETIIFENTNYKTAPPAEALKQKHQPTTTAKPQEEMPPEVDNRPCAFNGDVRPPARMIQDLIADNGRQIADGEGALGIPISFEPAQKPEDSSDMKLDFAFDSDLGQLTEDKTTKTLGLPRNTHMSTSNTISPLAADLNLKIASVKKVWEIPAVAEGTEELQFAGFEEGATETGAPPNVCKVKPTQQLHTSPPPQHYNHVGYQGGYGGLSVPSPPAVLFNSSQQLLNSSQQLQQQGSLYGAFLDQSRGQFGGFPGTPYGAQSATPYNYQPTPDMFQSIPNQYRMAAAAAGGGAAFGQSGQLSNSPSTVLISSSSNSLMSATVKPSSQQIGAIGSKGGAVGGVGGVGVGGGVNTYGQQYVGYSGPVGEGYSMAGLLARPAPPASSYYSPYQPSAAPAPTYPLQFTQPAQSAQQFLSSQLQVAAAVQQMQQQYRAPLQQQYAPRGPPQQLKSPLHEHANGFAPQLDANSSKPKPKGPHSPPHKYSQPPPPLGAPPHLHQQQLQSAGMGARCNSAAARVGGARYPSPIQRPPAPAPLYRGPRPRAPPHHAPAPLVYYPHNGSGAVVSEADAGVAPAEEAPEPAPEPAAPEVKAD